MNQKYLKSPCSGNLSDCNGARTHSHLVCKWTLNHLAKLTKWLSWVVCTYLYGPSDCMLLSCHVRISGACGFTLKRVHDIIITYSQMHRTDNYSQLSSIIWSVWPNGRVFIYELSGCEFESSCSHLNFLLILTNSIVLLNLRTILVEELLMLDGKIINDLSIKGTDQHQNFHYTSFKSWLHQKIHSVQWRSESYCIFSFQVDLERQKNQIKLWFLNREYPKSSRVQ